MFKSTLLTTFIALLCNGIAHVDARAVAAGDSVSDHVIKRSTTLTQRDVVTPPITYPTTGTVWNIGERHNCTWDTSSIPPGFKSNGMIVLGFLDDSDDDNEHLDLDHPLAKDFPITAGRAEITVPAVTTRDTYILVLFGDSGNASGKFTIKNISIGQPSSSAPSSPTSSGNRPSASGTSTETSSTGGFNIGGINGTATISSTPLRPSASGTPTASIPPSSAASSTAPASPTSSVPASAPSTASAAADGANPTTPTNNNAGTRAAPFGTWMSTMCSFAVVLGWLL